MTSHEPIQSYRAVTQSSNRAFGLVFAAVLGIVGVWPFLRYGQPLRLWALCAALVFLGLAIFAQERLEPLSRLWFKLGLVLHSVVSPLIMGLLFFGAVTPMGFVMRVFGKDLLRLRRGSQRSYWIIREPKGPAAGSMKNQF
jgi:predicted membrane metal-binding protein